MRRLLIDIFRDLIKKTPPSQRFNEPLILLLSFCLCCRLGLRRRGRDVQEETDKQHQHLHRDARIAFQPVDLPCQQVETAREGRFMAIGDVRRQKGLYRRFYDRRLRQLLAGGEIGDPLQEFGRNTDVHPVPYRGLTSQGRRWGRAQSAGLRHEADG
jgi:hypothetical protein